MRHRSRTVLVALIAAASMLITAPAATGAARIELPDGSQPEGLAISNRGTFYTGSLADGTIFAGSIERGTVRVFARGTAGRSAVGVEVRGRYLWVAGGETGMAWVFRRNGRLVRTYDLDGGFVNDVVVTRRAAYFTDSFDPVLHRVPIGDDGVPGGPRSTDARPLTGDIAYEDGFNANGIEVVRGRARFVIVQSNTGLLFSLRPSGRTRAIDLGGDVLTAGDGLWLDGHTLSVVQNTLNQVATVHLDDDLRHGHVAGAVTDPDFDVPTSIDAFRGTRYVVNARFSTPPGPDVAYWIASVPDA